MERGARHAHTFLRATQTDRPPALPPRRVPLSATFLERIRLWAAALRRSGGRASTFRVLGGWEWVSCDSRVVPHTVCLVVQTERRRQHLFIEKASARIVESDLRAAWSRLRHVDPATAMSP
jgi:hypothetical protein